MISYSKILVGVDLTHDDRLISEELNEHGRHAVEEAIELARGSGGEITFMTVIEVSEQVRHLIELDKSPGLSPVERDASLALKKLVQQAEAAGVKANYVVKLGICWELIIKEVIQGEYTLLVIGGKSHVKLRETLFGRTTTKLARKCPTPVLIARKTIEREIHSILVADDFSKNAERVLDAGVLLARNNQCRLHVLHVLDPRSDAKLAASGYLSDEVTHLQTTRKKQAEALLNERLSRTDYRTLIHGAMVHVEYGTPEEVIVEKVDEYDVDLLILGTIGRSGISAILLGNTAERVMNKANGSVLLIKPKNFVSPVKIA